MSLTPLRLSTTSIKSLRLSAKFRSGGSLTAKTATTKTIGTTARFGSRRCMTSEAHGSHSTHSSQTTQKSDLPWLIGSGAVSILGAIYLLTSPSKSTAHKAATAGHPLETAHNPASSEGAAIRGTKFTGESKERVSESTNEGGEEGEKEGGGEPVLIKDSEEKEEDVRESLQTSFDADAPKTAKVAEEKNTDSSEAKDTSRFDGGAPGQTNAETDKPEQSEKPSEGEHRSGTLQDEGSDGPTNLGDARKEAKAQNAPKEAA